MPKIFTFAQINDEDSPLVGHLATKFGKLSKLGFLIPTGFVISSLSQEEFFEVNDLIPKIKKLTRGENFADPYSLLLLSKKIEEELDKAQIPREEERKISQSFKKVAKGRHSPFLVCPSYDHKMDKYSLGIPPSYTIFSREELLTALKKCWQWQFEPSLLLTLQNKENDFWQAKISVLVKEMIFGEISGKVATSNPLAKNRCLVYAIWGLYDQSFFAENPGFDLYTVNMENLEIRKKEIRRQEKQLVRVEEAIEELPISPWAKGRQKLSDEQIKSLAKLAKQVVKHYFFPQTIIWTIKKNKIFILDLGPQVIEPDSKVDVPMAKQPEKTSTDTKNSCPFREKTATKIFFQQENEKELECKPSEMADGIILSPSDSLNNELFVANILPRIKSICQKIAPNTLFFHFPNTPLSLFDEMSKRNIFGEFEENLIFAIPASLWSEKLKKATQMMANPVWVSCSSDQDFLFLEQYILWGAKGVLVDGKNQLETYQKEQEDGKLREALNLVAITRRKHQIGTGLILGEENLSFDLLREAIFWGFSLVAIPQKAYQWAKEEIKLAERKLIS
jgi:hypothetical protein